MTPRVVLDASVVLKWFSPENEENVDLALDVYKSIVGGSLGAMAPTLLVWEVINVLAMKKKLDFKLLLKVVEKIANCGIIFVEVDIRKAKEVLDIMKESRFASYDCLYLWLAKEKSVPLLTEDSFLLEEKNTLSLWKFLKNGSV